MDGRICSDCGSGWARAVTGGQQIRLSYVEAYAKRIKVASVIGVHQTGGLRYLQNWLRLRACIDMLQSSYCAPCNAETLYLLWYTAVTLHRRLHCHMCALLMHHLAAALSRTAQRLCICACVDMIGISSGSHCSYSCCCRGKAHKRGC